MFLKHSINIPNSRLKVLIDYVLTKRNVCICSMRIKSLGWADAASREGKSPTPRTQFHHIIKLIWPKKSEFF